MADSACTGSRRGHGTVLILENISDQLDFISLPLMAHMQRLKAAYNDPDAAVCYLCWSWTPSIQTLERIHIVLLKRSRNSRLLTDIFFFFFCSGLVRGAAFQSPFFWGVCARVCVYELLNMCAPRGIFDLWFLFFLVFISSAFCFEQTAFLCLLVADKWCRYVAVMDNTASHTHTTLYTPAETHKHGSPVCIWWRLCVFIVFIISWNRMWVFLSS